MERGSKAAWAPLVDEATGTLPSIPALLFFNTIRVELERARQLPHHHCLQARPTVATRRRGTRRGRTVAFRSFCGPVCIGRASCSPGPLRRRSRPTFTSSTATSNQVGTRTRTTAHGTRRIAHAHARPKLLLNSGRYEQWSTVRKEKIHRALLLVVMVLLGTIAVLLFPFGANRTPSLLRQCHTHPRHPRHTRTSVGTSDGDSLVYATGVLLRFLAVSLGTHDFLFVRPNNHAVDPAYARPVCVCACVRVSCERRAVCDVCGVSHQIVPGWQSHASNSAHAELGLPAPPQLCQQPRQSDEARQVPPAGAPTRFTPITTIAHAQYAPPHTRPTNLTVPCNGGMAKAGRDDVLCFQECFDLAATKAIIRGLNREPRLARHDSAGEAQDMLRRSHPSGEDDIEGGPTVFKKGVCACVCVGVSGGACACAC